MEEWFDAVGKGLVGHCVPDAEEKVEAEGGAVEGRRGPQDRDESLDGARQRRQPVGFVRQLRRQRVVDGCDNVHHTNAQQQTVINVLGLLPSDNVTKNTRRTTYRKDPSRTMQPLQESHLPRTKLNHFVLLGCVGVPIVGAFPSGLGVCGAADG